MQYRSLSPLPPIRAEVSWHQPPDLSTTSAKLPVASIGSLPETNKHASAITPAEQTRSLPESQPRHIVFQVIAICLISIAVTINISNYGPLIPVLRPILHINDGQIGLFSTVLFIGIVLANLPGGMLADRFGARPMLLGSLLVVAASSLLFPLFPNFLWMLACRGLLGIGAGLALVTCSYACAQLGKLEPLAQGLNGGTAQLGAGLGLLLMPRLLEPLGWRGALFTCGFLSIAAFLLCLFFPKKERLNSANQPAQDRPGIALRTPAIWVLGLTNMGTFGLADAIVTWISVYFIMQFGLPLVSAGALGSLALFAGIILQPLGGLLLAWWKRPVLLIRLGTTLSLLSVVILALPLHIFPLALVGLGMFAIGTTLPYAAIFSTAANVGRRSGAGAGIAQGLIALQASVSAIAGAPLIGFLLEQTSSFSIALGTIGLIIPGIAAFASLFLKRVLSSSLPPKQAFDIVRVYLLGDATKN